MVELEVWDKKCPYCKDTKIDIDVMVNWDSVERWICKGCRKVFLTESVRLAPVVDERK